MYVHFWVLKQESNSDLGGVLESTAEVALAVAPFDPGRGATPMSSSSSSEGGSTVTSSTTGDIDERKGLKWLGPSPPSPAEKSVELCLKTPLKAKKNVLGNAY